MSVRASWWSLTINNPTPDDRAALKAPPKFVQDLYYQDEIGKLGTLHIQGCIHTIYSRSAALNDWLPSAHIEKAKKPPGALKNYVKKKDETTVEGTYTEWHAQLSATFDENSEIIEQNANNLGFLQALRMLAAASWIPQDQQDQGNVVEEMYKSALGTLFNHKPEWLQGLTGARILPTYKLLWSDLLAESAEFHTLGDFPTDDDDTEPEVFTQWQGHEVATPQCPHCDKDECDYMDSGNCERIISIPVV